MIEQCSKRESECQFLRSEIADRTKSLKILYAMLRSPKMCDLFFKSEKKRHSQEALKKLNDAAILTLRQYNFDEKCADNTFIDKIYTTLLGQV